MPEEEQEQEQERRDGGKVIYSTEHRALVGLLREAREAAGLTQAQLAQRLGRNLDYVVRVEGGFRRVDVVEWLWMLRALNADPGDFLIALGPSFEPPLRLKTSRLPNPAGSLPIGRVPEADAED